MVGGVDDDQIPGLIGQPVDDDVVDHPALLVWQERVLSVSWFERGDVVGGDQLQVRERVGAGDADLPHVPQIERPAADRTVRCSSITPLYWTGISQPAKGIRRAPKRFVTIAQRGFAQAASFVSRSS